MIEGKRPGGLTALAVLNFIAAAWDALNFLMNALFAIGARTPTIGEQLLSQYKPESTNWHLARTMMDNPLFTTGLALSYMTLAILLVGSGVGYLQQKRFLGRTLGSAYAVVSLSSIAYALVGMPEVPTLGSAQDILTLISAIYPVLTLILLNTTFRADLVRRRGDAR